MVMVMVFFATPSLAQTAYESSERMVFLEQQVRELTDLVGQLVEKQDQLVNRLDRLVDHLVGEDTGMAPETASRLPENTSTEAGITGLRARLPTAPLILSLESPPAEDIALTVTGEDLFDLAYSALLRRDIVVAERRFRDYLDPTRNPVTALQRGGEAHYWLGEIDYSQQRYEAAIKTYREGLDNYPDSSRAAEIMLKLGTALTEIGQSGQACAIMAGIANRYPDALRSVRSRLAIQQRRANC